ncbi:MAG TPA: hypothetical protein VKP65_22070 [Rhodothermales bacterium]|nr:hypothetical protein [Rhodothermales bacterium]
MKRYRLRYTSLLLLSTVLLVAGCASTQKRFEKAQDLEAEGRYAEAADYYIKVLEKERDWEDARESLQEVGAQAVENYLAEVEAAAEAERFDDAARALDRLDALRNAASSVGVTLSVPSDYASYRRDINRRAVVFFIREGEQAEEERNWNQALSAYGEARAYAVDPRQADELVERQGAVYVRWAAADADRDYFRASFDHAQEAIDLLGPDHPVARDAANVQQEALELGTRYVAFLPFWRTDAVGRDAPRTLIQDFNDVLLYDHWAAPVPFIAAADPVQIRRELRRLRYDRTVINRKQAAEIGRAARADFVVVGDWSEFEQRERNIKEKTRRAKLRGRGSTVSGGRDTTYIEQELTLELRGEITYRIIDPGSRRVVDEGRLDDRVSKKINRAVYAGDYKDLDLSGKQRSLFEDEERIAMEELSNELVDDLAARLAERVYDRLLRQIQ